MTELCIERALLIEGTSLPREELEWLAKRSAGHSRIVEIGSYLGRSTAALSDNTTGTVVAVDVWDDAAQSRAEVVQARYPHDNGQARGGRMFDAFCKNKGTNVTPVQMTSLDAANMFTEQGQQFDMIFIDASHDYESVKNDILAWWPLLTDGGLLCGHDYGRYGVTRAVDEMISDLSVSGFIWATIKPGGSND
jgi:predicted O-methyltransferase YrrM